MKYLDCPHIGRRPATEFVVAGVLDPEPAVLDGYTPAEWVFERSSVPMQRKEWWYHTPSQLWFIVDRDTASDVVREVTLAGEGEDD